MKDAGKFSGKKGNYTNFVKLIGKGFEDVRVMDTLLIPTILDTANSDPVMQRFPTEERLLDMLLPIKYPKRR